jgi:hypothetical protein
MANSHRPSSLSRQEKGERRIGKVQQKVYRLVPIRAAHAAQRSKRPRSRAAYSAALRARLGWGFGKGEMVGER